MTLEEANKKVNLISSCLNVEHKGELVICDSWIIEVEEIKEILQIIEKTLIGGGGK